jgi:hypothetical protein
LGSRCAPAREIFGPNMAAPVRAEGLKQTDAERSATFNDADVLPHPRGTLPSGPRRAAHPELSLKADRRSSEQASCPMEVRVHSSCHSD